MRKNKKTDVLLSKFKLKYRVIFSNKNFNVICKNHFDNKMGFAAFIVGLIENQIGEKNTLRHMKINSFEWIKLLSDIYDNEDVNNAYTKLSLNPIISLENIEKCFDSFDLPINKIIQYINNEEIDLKINNNQLRYLIKSSFGYIMYNCLDCKIPYHLKDILSDHEYDQKFIMITNNTKLFAKSKKAILSNCKTKINDLLALLIGISRDLNYDK